MVFSKLVSSTMLLLSVVVTASWKPIMSCVLLICVVFSLSFKRAFKLVFVCLLWLVLT